MRAIFSLVGILVVVAIVMLVARKQLQAVAPAAAPAGTAPAAANPAERSRALQDKVLQDVNRSLQQGADRASEAAR